MKLGEYRTIAFILLVMAAFLMLRDPDSLMEIFIPLFFGLISVLFYLTGEIIKVVKENK